MRRLRYLLAVIFLVAPVIAGCDSGLKEGMATDAKNEAPPALKNEMMKNAGKMQLKKGRPKAAPAAPAEDPK